MSMPDYNVLEPSTHILLQDLHHSLLLGRGYLKGWKPENQGHGHEVFYETHRETYKDKFSDEVSYRSLLQKQLQSLQPR